MIYVKPRLSVRQIVAELLSSQLAISAGLPCPQPYLVNLKPQFVGGPRGAPEFCFGCEQVGSSSAVQSVKNLAIALEMLKKAKAAEGVAVLDEWIANPVRHTNDILFNPEGAVWLIDHEGALAAGLSPGEAVSNWLAMCLKNGLPVADRVKLLSMLRVKSSSAQAPKIGRPPVELGHIPSGMDLYRAAMEFLRQRVHELDRLISQRIVPEQGYLEAGIESNGAAKL